MLELKNEKWYCSTHKVYLQICTNHSTGLLFLKCPCNKKFECGTVNTGMFNPNDYEYYLPNYIANLVDEMKDAIEKENTDYFHSSDFNF